MNRDGRVGREGREVRERGPGREPTRGALRRWSAIGRLLFRPPTWPLLLNAAWRFRRRHWYRRPPFLPLPSREYLAWRLHTGYGDGVEGPDAREFERYLRWVGWMNRAERS